MRKIVKVLAVTVGAILGLGVLLVTFFIWKNWNDDRENKRLVASELALHFKEAQNGFQIFDCRVANANDVRNRSNVSIGEAILSVKNNSDIQSIGFENAEVKFFIVAWWYRKAESGDLDTDRYLTVRSRIKRLGGDISVLPDIDCAIWRTAD